MKTLWMSTGLVILLGSQALLASSSASNPENIGGRWDAALVDNGPDVPFRLDISGSGPTLKATFFDGFRPYEATTSASFQDGKLVLKAEHYLTTISATLKGGALIGDTELQGPGYHLKYGFRAVRHGEAAAESATAPSIAGSWEIPLDAPSSKGEKAFRFIVQQNGNDVAASILRIDGDTGAYSGTYQSGKWVLSHFDGHRPGVIEVSANPDGTLVVIAHNEALLRALQANDSKSYNDERYGALTSHYLAYRPDAARAKNLPAPDEPGARTAMMKPSIWCSSTKNTATRAWQS
jgi:hypothetical protein